MSRSLRGESPTDEAGIDAVHRAAFGGREAALTGTDRR